MPRIYLVPANGTLNFRPGFSVGRVDCERADPESLCGFNLVSHQSEKWGHDEGRSASPVAKDACRDEVDRALAPPGPLNDEQPFSPVHQCINGLPLPIAELGGGIAEGEPEKFESSSPISHAFILPLSRRDLALGNRARLAALMTPEQIAEAWPENSPTSPSGIADY
jgi:hypothetical protein